MSWVKGMLVLMLLLSASFATVEADQNATARCGPGQSAYLCSGDAVKVVSTDGSTFYKPDGTTVNCPNAAATQIGAECVQLLMPNRCPTQLACGTLQDQNAPANVTPNTTIPSQPKVPLIATAKPPAKPPDTTKDVVNIPVAAPTAADFSMDNLALVVLLLGAISVGVIFTMFKNSISE